MREPPLWLVELATRFPGFEDALDAKWVERPIPPLHGRTIVAVCSCRAVTSLQEVFTASPDTPLRFIRPAQFEMHREPVIQVPGEPTTWVWFGRCPECKTIYWAGPVELNLP